MRTEKDEESSSMAEKKAVQEVKPRHCDTYIPIGKFLFACAGGSYIHRVPAIDGMLIIQEKRIDPPLYAKYKGGWVRIVMASRHGGVGITMNLEKSRDYDEVVNVENLSDFTDGWPCWDS